MVWLATTGLAISLCGAAVSTLSFRFVVPCTPQSPTYTFIHHGEKQTLCVEDAAVLEGGDITGVERLPGGNILRLVLSKDGTRKFSHATASNIGRRVAVVFGDRILQAPFIRGQTILTALRMKPEVDDATAAALIAAYPLKKTLRIFCVPLRSLNSSAKKI